MTADTLAPESLPRRSFVYRELVALGATFGEVAGAACALTLGGEDEVADARRLALVDLSPLPRAGFKGRATADWLAGHGIAVPEEPNHWCAGEGGVRALRLAPGEVLLLGPLDATDDPFAALVEAWTPDPEPHTYPVPRAETNCWFRLVGAHAAETMAKLCGVDLRPHRFAADAIAQTSVARLNAIVARADVGAVPAYDILTDSASASYMWGCLRDAMDEFDGRPVGLAALHALAQPETSGERP